MSTNLNAGAILEYRQYSQFLEQIAVNISHWRATDVVGTISDDEALAAHDDLCGPLLAACLTNQATYLGGVLQIVAPVKRVAVGYTSNGQTGVNMSDPMPRQVAGIFTKRTDSVGRANRGRYYIPFPPENGNDDGIGPTDPLFAVYDALAAAICSDDTIIGGSGTVTLEPVIFHRATATYTPVTGRLTRHKWATQRRRGIYGRPNSVPPELL